MIKKTMRDVFIDKIYEKMKDDKKIFFLAGDFGAPSLDKIKKEFSDRFINVGIAEQNLINVATGLGLEGFTVYAYAISSFLTMRAFEQIRINLALSSQIREINVNLVGVGAGTSYDVAGPTHHCIEDISIMNLLPNFMIFSPSDWVVAKNLIDITINKKCPKYLRFDSKPLPSIYSETSSIDIDAGFFEIHKGKKCCVVSTGYMTHTALKIANELNKNIKQIGVLDMFVLKGFDEKLLYKILSQYDSILTMEEGFIDKGGLDCIIMNLLNKNAQNIPIMKVGFKDKYEFCVSGREDLHEICGLDQKSIIDKLKKLLLR